MYSILSFCIHECNLTDYAEKLVGKLFITGNIFIIRHNWGNLYTRLLSTILIVIRSNYIFDTVDDKKHVKYTLVFIILTSVERIAI